MKHVEDIEKNTKHVRIYTHLARYPNVGRGREDGSVLFEHFYLVIPRDILGKFCGLQYLGSLQGAVATTFYAPDRPTFRSLNRSLAWTLSTYVGRNAMQV